jgi:hypothetical protein
MSAEYAKENKQNKLTALQVTHTEWINRCILVHNYKSGTMVNLDKTELLEEIMNQLYQGAVNFTEHDKYLLECNLTDRILAACHQGSPGGEPSSPTSRATAGYSRGRGGTFWYKYFIATNL